MTHQALPLKKVKDNLDSQIPLYHVVNLV